MLVSILLFAISANLDNFAIGVSYGIKKISIPLASNLLIAVITSAGTALSMICGKYITVFLPKHFGSLIIILVGIYGIVKYIVSKQETKNYDKNDNKKIEPTEAVLLGFALALNNIALGLGTGLSGLNVLQTSITSFAFSLVFIFGGYHFGNKFIVRQAELVSALLIIALGIYGLF